MFYTFSNQRNRVQQTYEHYFICLAIVSLRKKKKGSQQIVPCLLSVGLKKCLLPQMKITHAQQPPFFLSGKNFFKYRFGKDPFQVKKFFLPFFGVSMGKAVGCCHVNSGSVINLMNRKARCCNAQGSVHVFTDRNIWIKMVFQK